MRIRNWKALCGLGVYVCLIDGLPAYVGSGKHLLARVSSPAHHRRVFELCDEVLLFPCESMLEARELERMLIKTVQPSLNEVTPRVSAYPVTPEEKRTFVERLRRNTDT